MKHKKKQTAEQSLKNMKLILLSSLAFTFVLTPPALFSQNKSGQHNFLNIWEAAASKSYSIQSASLKTESLNIGSNRLSRHWLPTVSITGRAGISNDPANALMTNLYQRGIVQEDFNPSNMNEPGANYMGSAGVRLDLPLYQGGAPTAAASSMHQQSEAQKLLSDFEVLNEYSGLSSAFGRLMARLQERDELNRLKSSVKSLLSSYRLANKRNPVGYSGYLSLASLENTIEVLTEENESAILSLSSWIKSRSGLSPSLIQEKADALLFVKSFMSIPDKSLPDRSLSVLAMEKHAAALQKQAEIEKARFLPNAGIFSEANLYSGERNSSTSYSAGAYVSMKIFSAGDYGALREARLKAEAANLSARDEFVRQTEARKSLLSRLDTGMKSLNLMNETSSLLDEQITTSVRLFNGGRITASQLAEAYSKKIEQLKNITLTLENVINTSAEIILLSESVPSAARGE